MPRNNIQRTPVVTRFWPKVDRKGKDECWPWIAAKTGFGHGKILDGDKLRGAHCISYEIHVGPIPKGLLVRHTCDNPGCVNPNHLLIGNHSDNGRDMVERGRCRSGGTKGEDHPGSKINDRIVLKILQDARPSHLVSSDVGISASVIRKIRQGKAWAHIQRK